MRLYEDCDGAIKVVDIVPETTGRKSLWNRCRRSNLPPSIPRAIRVDHETGSVAVGKLADLLVVDDKFDIVLVIVRGEIKVENR